MKLNGWYRVGIVISIAWFLISNFIYFNEIHRFSLSFTNVLERNYYDWVCEDIELTNNYDKLTLEEKISLLRSEKPTFKLKGYFNFVFLLLIISWMVVIVIEYTFKWVYLGFKNK